MMGPQTCTSDLCGYKCFPGDSRGKSEAENPGPEDPLRPLQPGPLQSQVNRTLPGFSDLPQRSPLTPPRSLPSPSFCIPQLHLKIPSKVTLPAERHGSCPQGQVEWQPLTVDPELPSWQGARQCSLAVQMNTLRPKANLEFSSRPWPGSSVG